MGHEWQIELPIYNLTEVTSWHIFFTTWRPFLLSYLVCDSLTGQQEKAYRCQFEMRYFSLFDTETSLKLDR